MRRSVALSVLIATLTTAPLGARAEDQPGALRTPSEVTVALIRTTTTGYWVTTPCGSPAHVHQGTPIRRATVVIDPGHGGPIDTGAVAPTGMPEKELNLDVARQVIRELAARDIDAVLTRTDDYATPLSVRANLADSLGAEMMVSIHHNAPTPGPSHVPGIEVFIQSGSVDSGRLGGLLWKSTMSALSTFDVDWVAAADAGVMTVLNTRGDDAYGIIRHPNTPTVLIELGYISNRAEAELYQRPEYSLRAGISIAEAIDQYLHTLESGSGFVEGRVFNPAPGVGKDVCTDPPLGQVAFGQWRQLRSLPAPE